MGLASHTLWSIMSANGSGTRRYYSEADVEVAHAVGILAAHGMAPTSSLARRVADAVRFDGMRGLVAADGVLIVDLDAMREQYDARRQAVPS